MDSGEDKPVRVLVADDSESDRFLLAVELRAYPAFRLIGATCDGVETIAWLNATPPYSSRKKYPFPDLLLLDYQMPGYSGMDVLNWLHHQQQHCVVVLWSNAVDLIDQTKAYELGAALVCDKPGDRSDLSAILARAFPNIIFPSTVLHLRPTMPQRSMFDKLGR